MDDISILVGLIAGITTWFWLARCMKINGRPWWLRHLTGASLFIFPTIGLSMFFAGVLGATDDEGVPLGWSGAVMGLVVSLPMLIPLWMSWRKSKRRSVSHKTTDNSPKLATAAPQLKPKTEPAETLEQTLESNRQSARAEIQQRSGKRPSSYLAPRLVSTTGNLRFIYEDSQGNISTREVSNWREDSGYLKGYCHKAGEIRTFRLDRIVEFLDGKDLLSPAAPTPLYRKQKEDAIEILFTGFTKARRAQLEETANKFGMRVCKTVTVGLSFICAGPTAGSTKLRNAHAKGVPVLDESGFLKLLETGEIPE